MPSSLDYLDDKIENFLKARPQASYLDIGAGDGKFGKMIRRLLPKARVTAVEKDKSLKLDDYTKILNIDALDLMDMEFRTDVVIMGDIIEHLKKSDGIDLLNFLAYRSKYILVKFPVAYVQYGNDLEKHRSLWSLKDFERLDLDCSVFSEQNMRLVIIKGLLSYIEGKEDEKIKLNKKL